MRGDPYIDCNRIAAGLYKRATALVQRKLAESNGTHNSQAEASSQAAPPRRDEAPQPQAQQATLAPAPAPQADVPAPAQTEAPQGIPAQYVVLIQGRPFVKFARLLQMAHERGLVALTADWTYNDGELSLAHAVATFQDGRRFEESGDATPANTHRKVALTQHSCHQPPSHPPRL